MMVAEALLVGGEESLIQCVIDATGLATSPASVLRMMVAVNVACLEASATDVTELDILPANAPRVTEGGMSAGEVVVEDSDRGMTTAVPNATSATDLATSPGSVGRKKIAVTNAMELVTLLGIVAKMRILATIAMRLVTS